MIEGYPLHWPEGWPRTKRPIQSRFDTTLAGARDGLINEIRLLGGKQIILSTNIPLRQDGLPYARYKTPDDTGAAVYFQLNGQSQVFACDKWNRIEDNIQSIRKTIEAIRGIERWGSSEMLNRIYKGFQGLPEQAGPSSGDTWWGVLGVDSSANISEIERKYRKLAKVSHPDVGGSIETMTKLNWAITQARKEKS